MQGYGADGQGLGSLSPSWTLDVFSGTGKRSPREQLRVQKAGDVAQQQCTWQHMQAYMHIQRLILELCVAQTLILEPVISVLGKQRQEEPILEVIQGYVARSCL